MATISTLAFKILADSSQFTAGMAATKKELRIAKQLFEETRTPLEQYQTRMAGLAALHQKGAIDAQVHSRASKQLTQSFREAQINGSAFGKALSGMGVNLAAFVNPVTAAVAVLGTLVTATVAVGKALYDLGARQFEALDAIDATISKLGASAEGYQILAYATSQADTSVETLNGGLTKLARNVADAAGGGKKTGEAFKALGLDAQQLVGLSPDQVFVKVAEAMQGVGNANERVEIAMKLFGKSGAELLNLIDAVGGDYGKLAEAAERAGVVVGADGLAAISDADNAMKSLGQSVKGLGNSLAVSLADPLRLVVDGFNNLITNDVFKASVWETIKTGVSSIADVITGNPILNALVGKALGKGVAIAGGLNATRKALDASNDARKKANARAGLLAGDDEGVGGTDRKDRFAARKLEKDWLAQFAGFKDFGAFSKKQEEEKEKLRKAGTLEGRLDALTNPLKGLTAPDAGFKTPDTKRREEVNKTVRDLSVTGAFKRGSVEAFGAELKHREGNKQLEYAKRQNELATQQLAEQTKTNASLEKLAAVEAIA